MIALQGDNNVVEIGKDFVEAAVGKTNYRFWIKKNNGKEIIIDTKFKAEADITEKYVRELLKKENVKYSCLSFQKQPASSSATI